MYGIICITGVWDPVANISKVPMAIVNRDDATCVAYVNSKGGTEFIDNAVKVGYLEAKSSEECNGKQANDTKVKDLIQISMNLIIVILHWLIVLLLIITNMMKIQNFNNINWWYCNNN